MKCRYNSELLKLRPSLIIIINALAAWQSRILEYPKLRFYLSIHNYRLSACRQWLHSILEFGSNSIFCRRASPDMQYCSPLRSQRVSTWKGSL